MIRRQQQVPADDRSAQDEPKRRRCLWCRESFASEWAGERICTRCKRSNAWQSGAPTKSYPFNNRS